MDPRQEYLALLKKCLSNELYIENELRLLYQEQCLHQRAPVDPRVMMHIRTAARPAFDELMQARLEGRNFRQRVVEWPHTMIGRKRLDNLQVAVETVLAENIPGDALEAGVWRGGASAFVRAAFNIHGATDRRVWLADSFEGLPPPSHSEDAGYDFSKEKFPELAIDLDTVQDMLNRYGLLDESVQFLKGWFKDTLHSAPIDRLSILRLDGDLYESTMDTLIPLYDKVSDGGFVIIDDYVAFPPCKKAVEDFRAERGIDDTIHVIDWTGVYWRKGRS